MLQYLFFKQWWDLKAYVNDLGIEIIGDVPIYVAGDSADVWADPGQFYLDEELNPIDVAGCPPDAFSADGQLWGNPLFRWDAMKKDGYYFQYLAYVMLSMLIVTLCPVILTLNRKGVRERTMCSSLTSANYSRQTALGASILVFSIWLLFMIVAIIWGKTLNVKFWLACLNSFVYIIAAAGIAMIIAQFDLSDNGITAISNIIGLGMSFLCGVFVPQELLTGGVLAVGRLFPAYWYTKANNMLFGMSGGVFSTKEYLICIGIEALFAVAFFAVAALLVKQKREGDVNSLA